MWKMGAGHGDQADRHDRVFQAQVYYMMELSKIKPRNQGDRADGAKAWITKLQQEGQATMRMLWKEWVEPPGAITPDDLIPRV
jgi:hypothetical protein